jgi:hypothetical protein
MILAALLAAALAQTSPAKPHLTLEPPASPTAQPPATDSPEAALAKRLTAVRAQNTVSPMLVLVPNERAFLTALTQWRATASRAIFPILIDDGSVDARENIARFVRAFKPARILRLTPPAPADAAPVTATDTQATLYATFGAADEIRYLEVLNRRIDAPGPIGVVAAQADNPAGVALAAAYGQVLVITEPPSASALADYTLPAADKLSDTITAHLTVLKVPFAGLGDQVDAVTLCFDIPARVMVGKTDAPSNPVRELVAKPGEALSLTDIVGRDTTSRGTRWGYASQITGNHAAAAYRAMCSIFLQPTSVTAFNGYERASEFGKYNPADAIAALKAAGLSTMLIDRPAQSAEDWRQWSCGSFATREVTGITPPAGGALSADLLLVNTMGNSDFFQLQPGLCYAGDVPFLSLPAAVQFNHSWSLQYSGTPTTVGGRWLDRGAYVYVGSVHEPYLSAFVTPNTFAKRLTQGWPLAAAARILTTDKFEVAGAPPVHPFSAPWRIAVLGDALWTLGPALKRTTDLVPIPNSTDIGAELPKAGAAKNFAAVLDLLEMLGRSADAAHWAQTLANEPDKMDQTTARRALLIAYRAGDKETITKAAQRFVDTAPKEGNTFDATVADAVWHAFYPSLGTLTAEQANLLTHFIRPYSYVWDSGSAATALKRAITAEAARAFFDQQVHKAPDEFVRKRLEETRASVLH